MRFGTDGVRGVANAELTPEFTLALGRAAARVLGGERFLIGRDTRRSGTLLEAALAAGLAAEGVDVDLLGVMPTPAVACLSQADGVPAAVISASHNSFEDNGIKLFDAGGAKLADATQAEIEAVLGELTGSADPTSFVSAPLVGAAVGSIVEVDGRPVERYESAVLSVLDRRTLGSLRVVLDVANGAATSIAPDVFARAGAAVEVIHGEPDGTNINVGCGSTYPEDLCAAVVASGADLGFAFDGDADRVLAVDGAGRLIDGDQLIAIAAIDLRDRGLLHHDTVVVTVMSNLGFRRGMAAAGIEVVETTVGDRYVLEALDAGGYSLGGEQSGHLIFRDRATTGDGLLSALMIADVVSRTGRGLAHLADAAMTRLPQVLRNVRLADRPDDLVARLDVPIRAAQAELGDAGRILVRFSGTEPLVRVMVEAADQPLAESIAERLATVVGELGA